MKIGVIVDNQLNKDIRVLREINILREKGHEIFVLCFAFDNNSSKTIPGITTVRIKIKRWVKNILYFFLNTIPVYEWLWSFRTSRFIIKYNIEVVHVHDLYMSRAVHKGIARSGEKTPMILDLHENYPYTAMTYNWTKGFIRGLISRPEQWELKEKEYLGYAWKIIVLSNEYRDLLLTRYPNLSSKDFTIVPNVPELYPMVKKNNISIKNLFTQSYPIIFYFGVIAERRGVFDALRVFTELVKEDCKVNFLFIGPIDKKDKTQFLKMINGTLVVNNIHYIPWIDFSELGAYLEISDICIAPFHKNAQHESGIANKVFDYMLGKKPIIASDCLPQQILIEKYNCGLIYKNDLELKAAIINLLTNKELRDEMGQNGYKVVTKEYNTNMIKDGLFSLYNSVKS